MTSELQRNTIRTILITGCVILTVLMFTALILNLVKLGTLNARKRELEARINQANIEIQQLTEAVDEKSTVAFIDEHVRDYLYMCGEGEIVFIANN